MTHIVVVGDPVTGFAFHGPFDTADEATQWADFYIHVQWCVAHLEAPETLRTSEGVVLINDGATQWTALKRNLIAALDKMEWREGNALGMPSRSEPDDEDASYSHLCSLITPVDVPYDPDKCAKFTWYPDVGAWLWERT